MKKYFCLSGLIFIALLSPGTVHAGGASLSEFTVTDKVDTFWMRPVGSREAFPEGTEKIWATARLSEAPPETVVAMQVYYRDPAAGKIRQLHAEQVRADGPRYVAFSLSAPSLPSGAYQVRFLLDGKEAGFVNFSVLGGKPAAAENRGGIPGSVPGLAVGGATIAGVDAYDFLYPADQPGFYPGEKVAFLFQKVKGFKKAPDGRHWFDMDVEIRGQGGDVIFAADAFLGNSGHGTLPGGVAESPYAFYSVTDRTPPGSYTFTASIYDRIGKGRETVSRTFTVHAEGDDPDMIPPPDERYLRYLDPLRRFGIAVPKDWSLLPRDDPSTLLFMALDPDMDPLAVAKVNVHSVDFGGKVTARSVVAELRESILQSAESVGAEMKIDSGSEGWERDRAPSSIVDRADFRVLAYRYRTPEGKMVAEFKEISCVDGVLSILTFMAEEQLFEAGDTDPNLDWVEVIPGTFSWYTYDYQFKKIGKEIYGR